MRIGVKFASALPPAPESDPCFSPWASYTNRPQPRGAFAKVKPISSCKSKGKERQKFLIAVQ